MESIWCLQRTLSLNSAVLGEEPWKQLSMLFFVAFFVNKSKGDWALYATWSLFIEQVREGSCSQSQ